MLRWLSLVLIVCALVLTACVQPTPTPDPTTGAVPTAGLTEGYPALAATATAPAGYPAEAPTATPESYPAPSSRRSPAQFGIGRLAYH